MRHDTDHDHAGGHAQGHAHGGLYHLHGSGSDKERRVLAAFVLTASFMFVEVAGGIISGSLALLADAGHMLTDAFALGLAWLGFRASRRPADSRRSYGYHRMQVLAAFVNGAALLAIVVWVSVEAVSRLLSPAPIMGTTMLIVAAIGLVVNATSFAILNAGDSQNLNLRGAALHVLGDLLGSAAAIVAAVVILLTGWTPIDPLLSIVVAGLILRSGWLLVRQAGHILMEGTPHHIDLAELRHFLPMQVAGVQDVHHVHAWSLTDERTLMTLHAHVDDDVDLARVLEEMKRVLAESYGVHHVTIQLEPGHCADPGS